MVFRAANVFALAATIMQHKLLLKLISCDGACFSVSLADAQCSKLLADLTEHCDVDHVTLDISGCILDKVTQFMAGRNTVELATWLAEMKQEELFQLIMVRSSVFVDKRPDLTLSHLM